MFSYELSPHYLTYGLDDAKAVNKEFNTIARLFSINT